MAHAYPPRISQKRAETLFGEGGFLLQVTNSRELLSEILLVLTRLLTKRDLLVMNCRHDISINIEC